MDTEKGLSIPGLPRYSHLRVEAAPQATEVQYSYPEFFNEFNDSLSTALM